MGLIICICILWVIRDVHSILHEYLLEVRKICLHRSFHRYHHRQQQLQRPHVQGIIGNSKICTRKECDHPRSRNARLDQQSAYLCVTRNRKFDLLLRTATRFQSIQECAATANHYKGEGGNWPFSAEAQNKLSGATFAMLCMFGGFPSSHSPPKIQSLQKERAEDKFTPFRIFTHRINSPSSSPFTEERQIRRVVAYRRAHAYTRARTNIIFEFEGGI